MSWLTNFVRPKIRKWVGRKDVPDNLWQKCPTCNQMIFHRELEANLHVCPHCGHHLRCAAAKRLNMLFDDGAYQRVELPETEDDPLRFRDRKRYTDRLKEARAESQDEARDAVIVAHGTMGGMPAVCASFDFAFMGGSMGVAVGEAFVTATRLALLQRAPLIVVPASGGARMQEGILSLMQLPRTIVVIDDLKEAGLPYIVVLTDPTTGGVTASIAMLGDITIAEPGAIIGFAGPRVIEDTIRETLPEGFQRSEYLLEHGMVDMIIPRRDLRDTLIHLIDLFCNPVPAAEVVPLLRHGGVVAAEAEDPHGAD
ncbi:MAG: acetyl-CoA carboxylase, carboxyltransferase subunit beta [Kiloniellales bacterium]